MKKNISKDLKDNKQATESQEDNNQGTEVIDETENDEDEHRVLYRRSILRIVAGGYLLYLSYSGITEMLEDADSNGAWYFYLIYGIFAIIGIILVIDSFRSQIKNRKK